MKTLIQQIDELLKHKKIKVDVFACQLLAYTGEDKRYVQGTGEARRCNDAWKKQVYRWMKGKVTPRPEMIKVLEVWFNENK